MAGKISQQPIWLTQTQLQLPRLREDLIPRPQLNQLIRQSITTHRLTLISAPAGYGKTTLVNQSLSDFGFWISDFGLESSSEIQNPQSKIQNFQVAWLGLEHRQSHRD